MASAAAATADRPNEANLTRIFPKLLFAAESVVAPRETLFPAAASPRCFVPSMISVARLARFRAVCNVFPVRSAR
jgi:hypothetical protein